MLEPQTEPGAVRNRKRVNADIVEGTTLESPVENKRSTYVKLKRPDIQGEQLVAHCSHGQLEAAQHTEAADHAEEAAAQHEQAPPHVELPPVPGNHGEQAAAQHEQAPPHVELPPVLGEERDNVSNSEPNYELRRD